MKIFEPLYAREGGAAQAYKCVMQSESPDATWTCGQIESTARGMELHLASVHNFRIKITQEVKDGKQR